MSINGQVPDPSSGAPTSEMTTHAEGHQRGLRPRHRRPRRPRAVAAAVIFLAASSAAWGIFSRSRHLSALADWTNQQAVPTVAVAMPAYSTSTQKLVLPGDVQAFYEAPIYARVSGYLANWSQDIGAHVRRGQILGVIDTPDLDQELSQAKADLAAAAARQKLATLTAARWHALLASNSVSQQSADEKQGDAEAAHAQMEAQRAHLDRLVALESFKRLTAPFDGIVTARNTDVGALINAGSSAAIPLFKVADMHEMRVYVRVPQAYASQIPNGLHATLTEPQYPGASFEATLQTNAASVAVESRTVLAELLAPNPDGKLWAGTFAEVTFQLPADKFTLLVPAGALIFRSHGAELATVDANGRVIMKPVSIGKNLGDEIEIIAGISPDDRVITSPLDTLEAGQIVNIDTPPAKDAHKL